MSDPRPAAWLGGFAGTDLAEVTSDLDALGSSGRWAVMVTFEGAIVCARFRRWEQTGPETLAGSWLGPQAAAYLSSLDRAEYVAAVEGVRSLIAAGTVYQANICRIMSAPIPDLSRADVFALSSLLRQGNPAPYAGCLRLPEHGVHVASASPELFLRTDGRVIESDPIKGTGRTAADLQDKDRAENIMIVDLVRNDLGRVCETGSIEVPSLLRIEEHPTIVHLVSTIRGILSKGPRWPRIMSATFPPGSVTGAPKSSALRAIAVAESTARGPYCGAFGWVDADAGTAELAVAIRTFWLEGAQVKFGTGAGITWGSDPESEWDETELKASNLIRVAAGTWPLRSEMM